MGGKQTDLDYIPGNPRLLLIAPHGFNQFTDDEIDRDYDDCTAEITAEVAKKIGCQAIINRKWRKETQPARDYNKVKEAKKDNDFFPALHAAANKKAPLLVLWIHGVEDNNIKAEARKEDTNYNGKPDDLHALIGYGQGLNKQKKCDKTAYKKTVNQIQALLTQKGMTAVPARDNAPNYRGCDTNRMNQWFRNEKYRLKHVQSLQLEIKKTGFREQKDVKKTANILAVALAEYVGLELRAPVSQKVDNEKLIELFLALIKSINWRFRF